jgi:hypothetical protein
LIHALPKAWRISMRENFRNYADQTVDDDRIILGHKSYDIKELTSFTFYWHLLEKITKSPISVENWISEFPFLNDKDFENFYMLPNTIIKDTKLQTFQYAILNQIIPTNAKLFKWKLVEDSDCHYCGQYDNLTHFFYSCKGTAMFWTHLMNWLHSNFQTRFPLSKTDIIFGIRPMSDTLFQSINYLLLHGKWHIYRCKLDNRNPCFLQFLDEIRHKLVVEKYMYCVKDDPQKFITRFGQIYNVLID